MANVHYQAALMAMLSQIKSHLTKNPAISKFGPDIVNDFVQQPNLGTNVQWVA